MSLETPIQIDLSEENAWDSIDDTMLSEEEKDVLKEQFAEEKEGIIYLTQQEIAEFRNIMQNEIPETHSDEMNDFVEEQMKEGLTLEDMFEGTGEAPENITEIEAIAGEVLFGEEGILTNLELSNTAQDHAAIGFSLALLDLLTTEDMDITSFFDEEGNIKQGADIQQLLGDQIKQLMTLKELADSMTPGGPGGEHNKLHLTQNGETNSIMMNPLEGKDFFSQIFEGELDIASIEATLKNANDRENAADFSLDDIQQVLAGNIDNIREKMQENGLSDPETDPENVRTQAELAHENAEKAETQDEKNFWEKILKLLQELFQGFVVINSGEEDETGDEAPEPEEEAEEIAPSSVQTGRKYFQELVNRGGIAPFEAQSIKDIFPEGDELSENAKKILNQINNIPDIEGQNDLQSKLENLFGEREGKEQTKFEAFVEAGNLIPEITNPQEDFARVIEAYVSYRKKGAGELYTEYFQKQTHAESAEN